jgi:hypothetical protein
MTDLHVTPETLTGHARGCESLADKFGQLAGLLHQAKVDDQCFGPIGRELVNLLGSYFENLEECRNQATQAQEFLTHTAQSLHDAANDHQDNDRQIAEALQNVGKELGP